MALSKYQLEQEVKETREWLAAVLRCIGDGVIATDIDGSVTFINKVACELTGWNQAEAVGKNLQEVFNLSNINSTTATDSEQQAISPTISEQEIAEYALPTEKGKTKFLNGVLITRGKVPIEIEDSLAAVHTESGESSGSVVVFRDITAQKQIQIEQELLTSQLRQAKKMEAIGTLAGGIAHDFNNILSGIIGYAELAQNELKTGSTADKDIAEVVRAGKRAAELVKQILTFSRQTSINKTPLRPHLIVKEALKMLRASLPTSISMEENVDTECGTIMADPTNFHQVVVNLCTNALHAMPEEKGTLRVELQRREVGVAEINSEEGVLPGPFIVLSVTDTGVDMDTTTIEKIFEPYFTTKKMGLGTGLGLTVIHGIVKKGGGFIRVKSAPGKGTTFDVYFPALHEESGTSEEVVENPSRYCGKEHILVVDDEAFLVRVT